MGLDWMGVLCVPILMHTQAILTYQMVSLVGPSDEDDTLVVMDWVRGVQLF